MAWFGSGRRDLSVLAACVALALDGMGSAQASVISSTPTLPLLGVPYVSSTGAGCFIAAGVCVSPGTFTLTAPVSSTFDAIGQDIITGVTYAGILTNLSLVPIGLVSLSGTMEQEVEGRTFATETGSWTTELVALSLSGPLLGHTLTLALDPAHPGESIGTTSITDISNGDGKSFRIDSFFDVFVELSLDSPIPLHTTRGPIRVEATVPEPTSLALLAAPLLALVVARRRRPVDLVRRAAAPRRQLQS